MITIPTGIFPLSPFLMTGHEWLHAGMLIKKDLLGGFIGNAINKIQSTCMDEKAWFDHEQCPKRGT